MSAGNRYIELKEEILIGLRTSYDKQTFECSVGKSQQTQNICITFMQCWSNVEDVEPELYKCYTNVLCVLGFT